MRLEICLLDCVMYQAGIPSFPFVGKISFDERTEIAEKVDVNRVVLTDGKDEARWFGFSQEILGRPRDVLVASEDRPHYCLCNVFDDDDDASELSPGSYELYLKLTLFEKKGDESFRAVVLEATRLVTVK